jgi:hypothetical protein
VKLYGGFDSAISGETEAMRSLSRLVHTEKWQGMDISKKPEMATYELLNRSFQVPIRSQDPAVLAAEIKPNLPWADDHFYERVGGEPLNPGVQWANWPYAKSADRFRDGGGIFTHTYMERYWPKFAACPTDTMQGIRYGYGDAYDVIELLHREPNTRQAYLPVWFPEDTGALHGGRLPCTLGYHLIHRDGFLHIVYYLRSCDLVRHFRDDIYLTVRLLLWMLGELRLLDERWNSVKPGFYTMHITSLHIFRADWRSLFGAERKDAT